MLGTAVYNYFFNKKGSEIFGVSRQQNYSLPEVEMLYGDLASNEFINTLKGISFDYIIHCSAEVNVNLCETDREHAYKSNVEATKNLCSQVNAKKYLYISTDSVFDGQTGNYTEESNTNPLNYYATTKLLGEAAVKEYATNHYILRTNIFGFNNPMKKSLFEWAYTELKGEKTINGFKNMYFNPMYVGQLTLFIDKLLATNANFGTYNVGIDEKISKYDFLIKIAQSFNFSHDLVNETEFDQNEFVAPRALNTTLNNSKAKLLLKDFDFSLNKCFTMLHNDLNKILSNNEKN